MKTGASNLDHKARQLPGKWLYLAWVSMIFTTLVIGVIGGIAQGDPEPVVKSWGISDFGIFAVGLHAIGLALASWLLYRHLKSSGNDWPAVGLQGKLSSEAVVAAIGAVALAFVLYPIVEKAAHQAGLQMYWGEERTSHFSLSTPLDHVLAILGAALIVPVLEELLYRGYVLNHFLSVFPRQKAVLYAVLVFTSIHLPFGPGMMLYIFCWSWIPCWLFLRYKNLFPGIIFHMANNFLAYVVLPMVGM